MSLIELRTTDLKSKEIINIRDGERIGFLGDIEINIKTGRISALVIYGKFKFFGFLGREDDIIISWDKIEVIGEETILVNHDDSYHRPRGKGKFLKNLNFD